MFQTLNNLKKAELPILIWLFVPILIFLNIFFIKYFNFDFYSESFQGETGIIENATFVILILGLVTSFFILKNLKYSVFYKKKFYFFFLIIFLGLLYFAGEEVSWGDHWFNWKTLDFFRSLNDQSETNLHNISSWFDQKPRSLLLFFIFFGGIFYPTYLYLTKKKITEKFHFLIVPTSCCLPTSLICLFFYALDNLYKIICFGTPGVDIKCKFIHPLFHLRTSEIIELYISLFLLVYVLSIFARLKKI